MNINTRKISKLFVLNKENNQVIEIATGSFGKPLVLGNYSDYLASDKTNVLFSEEPNFLPASRELVQVIPSGPLASETANAMMIQPENSHLTFISGKNETTGQFDGSIFVYKIIHYLIESEYSYVEYSEENAIINGYPCISAIYHPDIQAFIIPTSEENYIVNETTFKWEPDPERTYDLHGDGKEYRYDREDNTWHPTW